MHVVSAEFELHYLAHQLHAIPVSLQEADVGVAIDPKVDFGEVSSKRLYLHCGNPRGRDDDVFMRCLLQALAKICRTNNRPNFGLGTALAKNFCSVDGCHTETDMTDVSV